MEGEGTQLEESGCGNCYEKAWIFGEERSYNSEREEETSLVEVENGSNMAVGEMTLAREGRCNDMEVVDISLQVMGSCSSWNGEGTQLEEGGSDDCKKKVGSVV